MKEKSIFCPHCGEYVAPRTFRRHKGSYFNTNNASWDGENLSSSDEESPREEHSEPVEMYELNEHGSNDVLEQENEAVEYMEVDPNRSRVEFWEDALDDVLADVNEDNPDDSRRLSIDVDVNANAYVKQFALVKWVCLFLLFWTAHFHVSDNAVALMLQFIHVLFTVIVRYVPWFAPVVLLLPTSVYLLRKTLGLCGDSFTKYIVCPHCHSLYTFTDCFVTIGSQRLSKRCSHRPFPNHRQRRYRATCGELNGGYLLKHEPSGTINSYLSPLVDELLVLWDGWNVNDEIVKGVRLCVASDLPAARKVSN